MKLEMKDPKTGEVLGVMDLPETLLKEPLSETAELTLEDKTAILNEAAGSLTKENYEELGRRLGYVEETAELEAPMKLLTKEVLEKLPPLYSQENVKDPMVQVKFFHPSSSWTWYAIEYDPKEKLFFGWSPEDNELGYASYDELASVKVRGLGIERDMHFKAAPLSVVKKSEHAEMDDSLPERPERPTEELRDPGAAGKDGEHAEVATATAPVKPQAFIKVGNQTYLIAQG
jgi:hypothetical protein